MKETKIRIILILLLIISLGVAGFIGYNYLLTSSKVEVPDFLGKDKQEVFEWCGQLDSKYSCEFKYEDSTSIDKDKVFQQSVSAGNDLTDTITFTISSGLITPVNQLNIDENTSRADVERWASENQIVNITYIEEENETIGKDKIIRIEPQGEIYSNSFVTVYVSKGPKEAENKETADGKIEVKAGDYLNLTVSDFEAKVKALGLVPNHNTSRDDSSSTVTKGNIVWHGSGTYEKGEKINYGICTEVTDGIVVKSGTYVGKTEEEFKTAATNLGLKANHNTAKDAYSSTVTKGNIVWHGSGTYEKNETFNYGLSLGSESGEIEVKSGTYIGKTEDEFKTIATNLGLKANHNTSRDDYSSTVAKGNIVWHGSGTYEKNETFNYGLSLGSSSSDSDEIIVKKDQYLGKTEEEFKTIATNLGLKPTHISSRDSSSSSVAKGSIVTHGYGIYEKGEAFNYGLSTGSSGGGGSSSDDDEFYISKNTYVGKTEDEFKTIATSLGLKPTHLSERDAYSSTVAKGSIVTHGYGTYEKGEAFNYGLSKGPESSGGGGSEPSGAEVTVYDKTGVSESEFKSYLSGLGLKVGTVSSDYSSVDKGYIIAHDKGTFHMGDSINYTVSLGKLSILQADTLNSLYQSEFNSSYEATKSYLQNNIFNHFSNVTYESGDYGMTTGYIYTISVNGDINYSEGAYYNGNETIIIRIQK